MTPLVLKAKEFAVESHKGQLYGTHPYVFHLTQVYNLIKECSLGESYEISAFLHDTIEDCGITYETIQADFGTSVADLVSAVTGEGENRLQCCLDTVKKLTNYPPAIALKMADRIANMRACKKEGKDKLLKRYMDEMQHYAPLFSQGPQYFKDILKKEFACEVSQWPKAQHCVSSSENKITP